MVTAVATPAPAPETLLTDVTVLREAGWSVVAERGWVQCSPPGATLPPAGWKAHVSAAPEHVTAVVDALRDVAAAHGLVFKFLPTALDARRSNSKGTLRSVSGKLGCIYAGDADTLGRIVADLRDRTRGTDGPDILTDLRCGPEPVFIRYGAFEEAWTFRDGQRRLALRAPDGRVVVDEGRARWVLPPWVSLPEWAEPFLAERGARRTNLPCGIRRALHFSNAGGVYEAHMRDTGEVVLVKEGRPRAALDGAGIDAATRLEGEFGFFEALQGTGAVPRVLGFHRGTRHAYLVREMLQGRTLAQHHVARWPWHHTGRPDRPERDAHEAWALGMLDDTAALLGVVHDRGLLVHDLHPGNLFVSDADGSLKLFDLETLTRRDRPGPPPLIVPDYLAGEGVEGLERDRYAHQVLAHALLAPTVAGWADPARRSWVRRWIVDHFGSDTLARLDAHTHADPAAAVAVGDPAAGFGPGLAARAHTGTNHLPAGTTGLGLGRGLAGVALALALHPDLTVPVALADRLVAALPALARRDPSLSTGAAGVALALALAGVDVDRDAWATATTDHLRRGVEPHLWHGVAGIALAHGVLRGTSTPWLAGDTLLADLLPALDAIAPGTTGGRGLLTGDAGIALAWHALARAGAPGAAGRAAAFLTPPPDSDEHRTGGLEGLGGWFLALATGPDDVLDAVADRARSLALGGIRHRDGGLAQGLAGTLVGLAALARRRPDAFAPAHAVWARHATAWTAGCGSALHDVHAGGPADDLEHGTAGHVLADALLRGGRHAA